MASSTFNPAGSGPSPAPSTSAPTTAAPSTATPTATPTASPAATVLSTSPSTTAAPTTAGPVASPTTQPTTGAPTTAPTTAAQPNADNIAVLRQSHETLQSLGDLNTVREGLGIYQKYYNEAKTLAETLGYTNESLQAAFKADLVGTLQTLRQEKETYDRSPQATEDARIQAAVQRAVTPIQQQWATQQAEKHNLAIDGEFGKMFNSNEAFKARNGAECPPEIRNLVHDRFIETLKWNQPLLNEVVKGKMSGLQKVFDEVVTETLAGYNKYSTWGVAGPVATTTTTAGGPNTGTPNRAPNGQFTGTLDDIIEGTAKADALPSMRGFK